MAREVEVSSLKNRTRRLIWMACYWVVYRRTPVLAHKLRIFLLRLFGADVDRTAHIYPRCRIWAPWQLRMAAHSCLANDVDCYNVAPISIGEYATISQYAYLCSASHDHNDPEFPLISLPISIGPHAWVAARAYVGPGVIVGEGSVVGANACAYREVAPWTVVGGNPANPIGRRRTFE